MMALSTPGEAAHGVLIRNDSSTDSLIWIERLCAGGASSGTLIDFKYAAGQSAPLMYNGIKSMCRGLQENPAKMLANRRFFKAVTLDKRCVPCSIV